MRTQPSGATTTTSYDDHGRITATIDDAGRTTSYAYDDAGRVTAVTAPDGAVTSTSYTTAGRVASRSDGAGNTTAYSYDPAGRLATVTDPAGGVLATTSKNTNGQVATVTTPAGLVTSYAYDPAGRQTTMTGPVIEFAVGEDADGGTVAPFGDVQNTVLGDIFHEADATGAEDAPVGHIQHVGAEVLDGIVPLGIVVVPPGGTAFLEGVVLQFTLTRLVTDRAVERVVGQQEFQDPFPGLFGRRAVHVHDLAVGHGGDAGRHQLRGLFHLDQAHAAHRRRRERGVVAIVRNEDAGLFGRLDDRGALGDAHPGAVDRDGDAFGHRIRPLRAPARRAPLR